MTTKQEIIADPSKFQRVCSAFVERNVLYCLSSLMYDIGQHMEESSKIFDADYDEMIGWFCQDDWEEPVSEFIGEADLDQLETIAETVGYWSDVVGNYPTAIEHEDENGFYWVADGERFDDEDDANQDVLMRNIESIRKDVLALITNSDEYQEIGQDNNLDPRTIEVYEHWLVDRYFGARLKDCGEVVFEFENMTIWGRTTTGQAISMDYVIEHMVKGFDDDHWVWMEA